MRELRPTAKPFDGIKKITFGKRVHQGQKRLPGTWQTQERHLIWRIEGRAAIPSSLLISLYFSTKIFFCFKLSLGDPI
jgi:hypothetical protein